MSLNKIAMATITKTLGTYHEAQGTKGTYRITPSLVFLGCKFTALEEGDRLALGFDKETGKLTSVRLV